MDISTIYGRDVKYNVDKKNKIIVAYIENEYNFDDPFFTISRNMTDTLGLAFYIHTHLGIKYRNNVKQEYFMLPLKMKACARCHENDEWNEELGKIIAYRKLENKFIKTYRNRMIKIIEYYRKYFNNTVKSLISEYNNKVIISNKKLNDVIEKIK